MVRLELTSKELELLRDIGDGHPEAWNISVQEAPDAYTKLPQERYKIYSKIVDKLATAEENTFIEEVIWEK